jgi:hypothetical protein
MRPDNEHRIDRCDPARCPEAPRRQDVAEVWAHDLLGQWELLMVQETGYLTRGAVSRVSGTRETSMRLASWSTQVVW